MSGEQTYVIGVNGGATHTSLVVLNNRLEVLARSEVGSTNFRNVGFGAAISTLENGITTITRQAKLPLPAIAAIGMGMAGVDHVHERNPFREALELIFPTKLITVENDAVPALVGGSGRRYGMVVIGGTGSIAVGIDEHGKRARTGGWGYHVDRGSGFAIARESLSAATRAQDGIGPATQITERLLARLNLRAPHELVDWLYSPGRRIDEIAALAAETVALAETDLTATGIIADAARSLAETVIALGRQLDFGDKPFPLVMSGSLLDHCALLRDLFKATVQPMLPHATVIAAERDAAVGAGMMALAELGISFPPVEAPVAELPVRRPSEQRNRLTMQVGHQPALNLVTIMNIEDRSIPSVIASELPHIAALITDIAARFSRGGRLILAGAGTSGRLAVLDAAECVPTFGTAPDRVIGLMAGGQGALVSSVEDAEDDEASGRVRIAELNVSELDSVIGVAASGSTPFVKGILKEAAQRGALTGSIACAPRAPISELSQYPITLVTGPEVIMGSTRLKAGTAQKLVLNMITTGTMVQAGRTFDNLMTDMLTTNAKLRERAIVIVAEATGLPLVDAKAALERGGDMKTAIAAVLLGTSPEEARARLTQAGDNLNRLA